MLLSLNRPAQYTFSASMLNNKCFSERKSTCINLEYIVYNLFVPKLELCAFFKSDEMVINLSVEKVGKLKISCGVLRLSKHG